MSDHLLGVAEIAAMLGVSRQRVAQLMDSYEDFPSPEAELSAGRIWARSAIETWLANHPERGPGKGASEMFARFTDAARRAVVYAQEEARQLRHGELGTAHLLLGLLRETDGRAAAALGACGVELEPARDAVRSMWPEGSDAVQGPIPFGDRAKEALKASLRESLQLGGDSIDTDHLLMGMLREGEIAAFWRAVAPGVELAKLRQLALVSARPERMVALAPKLQMLTSQLVHRAETAALQGRPEFTQREAAVLRLVSAGLSDEEIATHLKISPGTVRNHLRNIGEKLTLGTGTAPAANP
jgi:DNA-binding CsgD family transcriptional regulator/predicted DNA-binding transcriptional regulator AlpA